MIRTSSHKFSAEQQNTKLSENWRTAGRKFEFQSMNIVIFVFGVNWVPVLKHKSFWFLSILKIA